MTTETTTTTQDPTETPYAPWPITSPIESADGWEITGNPAAGTFWVKRGPAYANVDTEEDTEPVSLFGVEYSISALCEPDGNGGWGIARISGFRVDSGADLSSAAKDKAREMVREVVEPIWSTRGAEIAEVLDRGRRKVDRERLIETLTRLKEMHEVVKGEIHKLDVGEEYQTYPLDGEEF